MITLADFKKYEQLEEELKAFLVDKINEYNEAKAFNTEDYYKDEELEDDFEWWEFEGLNIKVIFENSRTDGWYNYTLPLDILFDPDFKQKMKARFDEERERKRLELIEHRKKHEVELRELAERRKVEEIEKLKELIEKYPDVVKEKVF